MKCVVSLLSAIAMAAANAAVLNTAEESIGVVELGKTFSAAYNPEWCGVPDGDEVLSVISVNGEVVCSRTGAGTYEWTPLAPGKYLLTVRASVNGVATGSELSRTILVRTSGAQGVPLCSGSSTAYLKEIPTYPWQRRTAAASESIVYSAAWATNAANGAKAVVRAMPVLKSKPKYLVVDLSGGTNATSYALSYLDDVPDGGWSDEYKTERLVLRHIPAGSFVMGGRATDYPGAANTNLHRVTITRDFYMGVFEVTQRQWELVMGTRPSAFSNETCYASRPVERISYQDIRGSVLGLTWPKTKDVDDDGFLGVLRRRTGLGGLDLPTEAQWEYACRAETTTSLNSGRDISSTGSCSEADEVARYAYNSGWVENGRNLSEAFTANTADVGTAKVGSYLPNAWGLYDMHGNVWELCVDKRVDGELSAETVDPVGCDGEVDARFVRGGSFVHPNSNAAQLLARGPEYAAGYRCEEKQSKTRSFDTGFRLCLQGWDLPDFAAATTLADEAGAGAAVWSPARAGAYYLTHATMNSETNAQLLSAWFEVAGPRLSLVPQGELTNGVMVAIAGGEDGWTIRYTTDGSAPNAASPGYDGAFSLSSSGTVRAVAYSDGGVASEEVCETFTLHDALSLVGAVARQWYPWNGKVDIDCELKGDPEQKYLVSLSAKDLDDGTVLPLKTAWVVGGDVTNSVFSLAPGRHRLVWDADADIASDGDFPRVAVSVTAEGGPLVSYSRRMTISVDGYAGSETLTNVPVLVRLSMAIAGFDYGDFARPSNGADLAFFDAGERRLACEIDEWNTNGESLVWVKLPELTRGTRFTAAWGAASASMYGRGIGRGSTAGQTVWRDYAGVWHMNEASGVAYDSTANGLDAQPDCGTNGTEATLAQMVAYENGACGKARVNSLKLDGRGNDKQNFMLVPSYDALGLGSSFVVAGWFKGEYWNDGTSWYPRLVSRKSVSNTDDGWEICLRDAFVTISDETNFVVDYDIPDVSQEWVQLVVVYESDRCICFINGVSCGEKSLSVAVSDNGGQLAFGNTATGSRWSFIGQYDEIRLRGGTLSADRIKADYDMVADRGFLGYGEVTKGAEAAE